MSRRAPTTARCACQEAASLRAERGGDVVGQLVEVLGDTQLGRREHAAGVREGAVVADRHQPRHRRAAALDDDLLAGPRALDELGELRFGFVHSHDDHERSLADLARWLTMYGRCDRPARASRRDAKAHTVPGLEICWPDRFAGAWPVNLTVTCPPRAAGPVSGTRMLQRPPRIAALKWRSPVVPSARA